MATWVLAWIALGVAIGIDVHHLTTLNETIATDGHAVQRVGHSLSALSGVPFVGGSIGRAAAQLQSAGTRAATGAARSAGSIRDLSVLLAIAVALLPSVPVLGFYLPVRIARMRETRAVRRAVRAPGSKARLRAFLAQRAVDRLDYGRLEAVLDGSDYDSDVGEQLLAAAELRRLGIDPRALAPPGAVR